jgi:hypothetical protein
VVADDGRQEVQADAELLELDADRDARAGRLRDRNRELTAGKKAGFLPALRDQVRLGEALEQPFALQRLDDRAKLVLQVEHEQVQVVAELGLAVVEERRWKLAGGDAADDVLVPVGEPRGAELLDRVPAHFREADLQQDLVAGGARQHLQQRDHLVLLVHVAGRQAHRLVDDVLRRGFTRQDNGFAAAVRRDFLAGEQLFQLLGQAPEITLHVDLVFADAAGAIPHEHGNRAGHLAVDQQLARRGHERVRHVGAGQRDARDGGSGIDDRRSSDGQVHSVAIGGIDDRAA